MNYDVDLDLNQKSSETDAESENMAKGAALQVKIEGEGGDELLDLLIGVRAPESSATRDDRFIRLPNEEVVYTADFIGIPQGSAQRNSQNFQIACRSNL